MSETRTGAPAYAAFVSYRHLRLDRSWARWLHRKLERYRTPQSAVARSVRPRIGIVFRDDDELAASASLPEVIREALTRSKHLIVVCTPSTPHSKWIDAEIEYFAALGRRDAIGALLIRGTPTTSFPPAFERLGIEPAAADVRQGRWVSPNKKRRALLKTAAALLDCGFDDLYQRDLRRRRTRQAWAGAAALVLVVGLAWYARQATASHVAELATYSDQSLSDDESRSVLLSKTAMETSRRRLGIGNDVARRALVRALTESAFRDYVSSEDTVTRGLAWRPDGVVISGGWNGHLRAWDLGKKTTVFRAQAESWIERIVFRPRAPAQVAIAGGTRVTALWDLTSSQSWKLLDDYQGVVAQASDVSWCANGQRLASSAGRDVITLLEVGISAPQRLSDPEWGYVNSVAWDPGCRRLAIGAWRGLFLWNTDTKISVRVGLHMNDAVNASQLESEGVLRVAWSPGGDLLATGGQDRTVRVWLPDSEREAEVLSGHIGPVYDVAWTGGGRFATASADGTVRIWSKEPFSDLYKNRVINTGQGRVYSLAWSPDGEKLASGGDSGGVRIWRAVRGPEVVTLSGRQGTLDVTNGGELVFDGALLTDDQLLELARSRAARNFTNGECEKFFHGACP